MKIDINAVMLLNDNCFEKDIVFPIKVMDVILFVLMSFEIRIIERIQGDELMMEFLKKASCELSLMLLNKEI